jgi:hypothetical protein
MTTEELMKLRWKVIADFPSNEWFEIGDIIIANSGENGYKTPTDDEDNWLALMPDRYPAIFKKLEWWECRKEEDLPEYVKSKKYTYKVIDYIKLKNKLITVSIRADKILFLGYENLINLQPSTKEEYEIQQRNLSKTT